MSLKLKRETGLADDDVQAARIFMRSLNQAIRCTEEIAQRDYSTDHYKDYMKVLMRSLQAKNLFVDKDQKVVGGDRLAS